MASHSASEVSSGCVMGAWAQGPPPALRSPGGKSGARVAPTLNLADEQSRSSPVAKVVTNAGGGSPISNNDLSRHPSSCPSKLGNADGGKDPSLSRTLSTTSSCTVASTEYAHNAARKGGAKLAVALPPAACTGGSPTAASKNSGSSPSSKASTLGAKNANTPSMTVNARASKGGTFAADMQVISATSNFGTQHLSAVGGTSCKDGGWWGKATAASPADTPSPASRYSSKGGTNIGCGKWSIGPNAPPNRENSTAASSSAWPGSHGGSKGVGPSTHSAGQNLGSIGGKLPSVGTKGSSSPIGNCRAPKKGSGPAVSANHPAVGWQPMKPGAAWASSPSKSRAQSKSAASNVFGSISRGGVNHWNKPEAVAELRQQLEFGRSKTWGTGWDSPKESNLLCEVVEPLPVLVDDCVGRRTPASSATSTQIDASEHTTVAQGHEPVWPRPRITAWKTHSCESSSSSGPCGSGTSGGVFGSGPVLDPTCRQATLESQAEETHSGAFASRKSRRSSQQPRGTRTNSIEASGGKRTGDASPRPWNIPAFVGGVNLLLAELRLSRFVGKILDWCEEMGAAHLEEIVESSEFLAAALIEDGCAESEVQRMRRDLPKALSRVNTKIKALNLRVGRVSGASATSDGLSDWNGAPKVISSLGDVDLADWPHLVQRERQSKKKKQSKMQRLSTQAGEKNAGTKSETALEKLQLQLKEEEEKKLNSAIDALESAIASAELEPLATAIEEMRNVGLESHARVVDAQQKYDQLARRHSQRCEEAVCALQAAVEAPRDDGFGTIVREALDARECAWQTQGGEKAINDAEYELRLWEDIRIALQIALRSNSAELLGAVLEEPEIMKLPPQHSLLAEARLMLKECIAAISGPVPTRSCRQVS